MERRLYVSGPEPRFWQISVASEEIVIRRGLQGTPGTEHRITCKSPADAAKTAQTLVTQRLNDGFRDRPADEPAPLSEQSEEQLLEDDLARWSVFADSLMETPDAARGELIALQVQVARKVRGSITRAKKHIQERYDDLVGGLGAFHKQVTIDWKFGYARTARVWMGPYGAPLADVLPAVFASPASRFLQRLELGSPGTEGRYDPTLKALGKLDWPRHLSELVIGAFDLEALKESGQYELAWPRLESLAGLVPRGDRLRRLSVRAVINTLGHGPFPELERLHVHSSRLDARVVSDLSAFEAPKLRALSLTVGASCRLPPDNLSRLLRQYVSWPGLRELGLHECAAWAEVLAGLGPDLDRFERLDLGSNGLTAADARRLVGFAPLLQRVTVDLRGNPLGAEAQRTLEAALPSVLFDAPPRPRKRAAREERE